LRCASIAPPQDIAVELCSAAPPPSLLRSSVAAFPAWAWASAVEEPAAYLIRLLQEGFLHLRYRSPAYFPPQNLSRSLELHPTIMTGGAPEIAWGETPPDTSSLERRSCDGEASRDVLLAASLTRHDKAAPV